jgi:hypothetical protein
MERLLKYSTLIYAFLLFLGYAYLDTYYNWFGIEIFSFLDTSEILLSFLRNINTLGVFLFIVLVYIALTSLTDRIKLDRINNYIEASEKRKSITYLLGLLLAAGVVIFSAYQLVITIMDGPLEIIFILIYILIAIVFIVLYKHFKSILETNKKEKEDIERSKKVLRLIIVIAVAFGFNFLTATYAYRRTIDKKETADISFNYDNRLVKTNDTILYIGSTSKYIFLRNVKKKSNLVFEKEKITNLSLLLKNRFLIKSRDGK